MLIRMRRSLIRQGREPYCILPTFYYIISFAASDLYDRTLTYDTT